MANLFRLIAALFMLLAATVADAQSTFPNQAAASAACEAHVQSWRDFGSQYDGQCTHHPGPVEGYPDSQGYYYGFAFLIEYGPGSPTSGTTAQFIYAGQPDPCEVLVGGEYQEWHKSATWPPSGVGCREHDIGGVNESCNVLVDPIGAPISNADGSFSYRVSVTLTGSTCSEETDFEPVEEVDAGDGWTCEPTSGLCTDPEGEGKLCTFNPDGTRSACVDYKPGDGTDPAPDPDPNDDPEDPRDNRSASGGAGCAAAPACSGDPIDCAQLWQQWKTRCAAEKQGSVSGAGCVNGAAVQLNCTNMDAARCFDLQMQTEAACRLAALDGGGDDDGVDWGGADQGMGTEYTAAQGWADGQGGAGGPTVGDLDDSGFLGGSRSCPTIPTVSVFGTSITFDIAPLCGFLGIGSQLVLLFAALAAARIIGTAI